MNKNTKTVETFISHWGADNSVHPNANELLLKLEKEINLSLPESFKELTTRSHKLFCPAIASEISCRDLEMYDVQDFIAIEEIQSETQAHIKPGLPDGHIAFGYDCMRNILCFRNSELEAGKSSVHVFDHDDCEVKEIAPSFEEWLEAFNELK